MVREHRCGKRFDFAKGDGRPPKVVPCDGGGFNAAAHGEISHALLASTPAARSIFATSADSSAFRISCMGKSLGTFDG